MDTDTELQKAREEVHQGIGRNLLLFQRGELMLKELNALGALNGPPDELEKILTEQKAVAKKQTLGMVMNQFREKHCIEKDPFEQLFSGNGGTTIAFGFSFSEIGFADDARKRTLDEFLAERNFLVHQMFAEYDSDSLDQCRDMIMNLDAQREKILPEFRRIAAQLRSVQEGIQNIAAYLASPEGMAE